jgi:hypothetical protein
MITRFATTLLLCLLAACGTADPAELGLPAHKVTVVRAEKTYPVTVEILSWEKKVHPQVPDRGDGIYFNYQFTGTPPETIEVMVCAVDDHRVVLLCGSVFDSGIGNQWLGPYEQLSRTVDVLLLPNQMYPGLHAGDSKDHDGYVAPRFLLPGDRL